MSKSAAIDRPPWTDKRVRVARFRWIPAFLLLLCGHGWAKAEATAGMFASLARLPKVYGEAFNDRLPAGWKTDGSVAWIVKDGRYRAEVAEGVSAASIYFASTWKDCFVELDCVLGDAAEGTAGVVVHASSDFRGMGGGSGYLFAVRKEQKSQQFCVIRRVSGTEEFLKPWTPSKLIRPDENQLAALCFSGLLQLYVNGQLAWEGYDDALPAGRVGLFAGSAQGERAAPAFDNVSVKAVGDSAQAVKAPTPDPQPDPPPPAVDPVPPPAEVPHAPEAPRPVETPELPGDPADKSPLLRPGLLVRTTVYVSGKREIDAELKRVSDNSQLDMPLIGNVSVDGVTLRELNLMLQTRYRDYFIDPQVVAEFAMDENPDAMSPWGSVVVLGRVKTPGRVNIPPTQDLSVSAAIQQAGGLDSSAKASAIRLTRRKPDGEMERINIDFTAVGKRGNVENDLVLKPGDQIFVPESVF